ncbi:MAG: hypothetical protein FJ298_12740 [Planctomycetes bacterium]|nr:hypothetical protein [Planctomycetota bacterium]
MRSLFLGVLGASLLAFGASEASAQTIAPCTTGGPGGLFPTSGTGGGGAYPGTFPPFAFSSTLNVSTLPAGATCVTEIKLNSTSHTWAGDVQFVLTTPSGARVNLLNQAGDACDFLGDYSITSSELYQAPGACTAGALPPGQISQIFGNWPTGTNGVNNTPLSQVAPATGDWTLSIYDWYAQDAGALSSWDICFGTPPPVPAPTYRPTLLTPSNGQSLFGPAVTLTWTAVPGATGYDVDVDGFIYPVATGLSFAYTSTTGAHSWAVRAKNTAGVGPFSSYFTFNDLGPPPSTCNGPRLATLFTGTGGLVTGNQMFFDMNVIKPGGITVAQLQTHCSAVFGQPISMLIYTRSGSFVGFETNAGAWTLRGTGSGTSAGANQPSLLEFPDFALPQGVSGFAVVMQGAVGHKFSGFGTSQTYSDANVIITAGKTLNVPFSGTPNNNKVWNGAVIYDCFYAPPPVTYCTAGTSTNGCVPSIAAANQPKVSLAGTAIVSVSNVEGQKQGLLFYGINNTGFVLTPWSTTSSSYLCVRAPTQRHAAQNSGGTAGLCNGSMVGDFHAFFVANPTALGMPLTVGQKIYAQAWYRDPPAPKTTNLSNGIELTVGP